MEYNLVMYTNMLTDSDQCTQFTDIIAELGSVGIGE